MKIISSIEIINFRSISRLNHKITPNSLNIIVGKNDIGKSNFLKALNLFFNDETEIGNKFRFYDDFCKFARVPNKKAAEIIIKITFNTPKRFRNNEDLVWTKVWRKEGLHKDEIKTITNKIPKPVYGGLQWIRKIKYKYVPAIRGNEYFNYLMGDLHDALSEINPQTFNEASSKFIDQLKEEVNSLIEQITLNLGYSSQIGMPSDFKSLFSTLDFNFDKNGSIISLKKRGDGIKAQHIPVILKFISNHYKSIAGKAIINPETIWGFEEPENNMEMANAFKMAKVFANFSNDIQIFINTHSPAYYSLAKEYPNSTNLYLVRSDDNDNGTQLNFIEENSTQIFDEEVGILPLITNHIKKEVELKIRAEKKAEELSKLRSNTKCLVLTEDSDISICECLFASQGFDMTTTEIISYEARTNLLAAMQSCKIELINRPDLKHIIFHRDSDIYDNDELDQKRVDEKLIKLNQDTKYSYTLFKTEGYDLESYFINAKHIYELYPLLSEAEITNFIDEATEETKDKSLDKLYEKIDLYRKDYEARGESYKFSNARYVRKVERLYTENPQRYRYGKTVLGILSSKIQNKLGENVNLLRPSSKITIPLLKQIVEKINNV